MRGLLIMLSGARPEILALCPTERVKFQSLGSALLISGVLAAVSMWFALASAMGLNPLVAVPVALAWGAIVIGIDRWLVISLPAFTYGARRWAIAVPRLLLSALLGVLVATPLVLQIFRPEINAQIAVINAHAHHPASDGLLIRLQALDQLASANPTINVSGLLLSLLFVIIECVPLILRLMQQPGNYEKILRETAERELRNAKWALRSGPSVGRFRPLPDGQRLEPLLQEIWGSPNIESAWKNDTVPQPVVPPLYRPAESDEHARLEDMALRGMEDIATPADLDMRGGIALRYDDEDL